MVSHNNEVPHEHFHKHWMRRVRTWFNQPARKLRRRMARVSKAAAVFPRPAQGALRPAVHPPTARYNYKLREGRGFTLGELREAKVNARYAKTIGIAVDYRRKDRSEEVKRMNVARIKAYMQRLVLFPLNPKRTQLLPGDATAEETKKAVQIKGDFMPIAKPAFEVTTRAITEKEKRVQAFTALRQARYEAKAGVFRAKKAARAAEAAKKAQK